MKLRTLMLLTQLFAAFAQEPIVETSYGKVKGKLMEFEEQEFTAFYSLPFAAAPVGALRFKPPQRHAGWGDTVYDAQTVGPWCPQVRMLEDITLPYIPSRLFSFEMDEDCLRLDVYVPGDASQAKTEALPVMVVIHGGGFTMAGSSFQLGHVFATHAQPMVVVTIQYRLTVLGFMTTGDEVLPGNLGLKDQAFALQWVKENIDVFGGDPVQVTICGESAGGESVLAHMISPMSKGLFQKASAQSAPYAWLYPDKESVSGYFKEFANGLGCEGSSDQAIECLRGKSWEELVNVETPDPYALTQRVIDGEFITDAPRRLWAQGDYNEAELMVGFTSNDGALLTQSILFPDFYTNRSQDLTALDQTAFFALAMLLADDFGFTFTPDILIKRNGKVLSNLDELTTMLKGRYYHSASDQTSKAMGILDMSRDSFFVIFALFCANQMAQNGGTVHAYMFDHRGKDHDPSDLPIGADHGSELPFQFGYTFTDPEEVKMTEAEHKLSRSIIQAWSSFGNGKASFLTMDGEELEWSPYSASDRKLLVFDTNMSRDSLVASEDYFQPVLEFWLALDSLARFEDPKEQAGDPDGSGTSGKEEL